jgi:hypothetical protein
MKNQLTIFVLLTFSIMISQSAFAQIISTVAGNGTMASAVDGIPQRLPVLRHMPR